jgi:AcrR family transcriptional regulator
MKKTYSPSEKTQKKILTAAQELFAKEGYAATSISTIAAKAKINQSLIYHHFGSKELLWKAVKQELVQSLGKTQPSEIVDLDSFLRECFVKRLDLYLENPQLLRIMNWQKMESKKDKLAGGTQGFPGEWRKTIEYLQAKKQIDPALDPELVIVIIVGMTSGAVSEDYDQFLMNTKNREKYIKFALSYLKMALYRNRP